MSSFWSLLINELPGRPIADRAHEHSMRLSGHIPAFMSARQAVEAGYDEIQHINMVFLNFLAGDREDTSKQLRFTLYGDEARNLDLDSQEVEDFIALLKKKDVVVDAIAAIFETMLIHTPGQADPTFAAVVQAADLVLIDGNPFEDISAVRHATLVMKGDTLNRPEELYPAVGVKPFLPSTNIMALTQKSHSQ